MSKEVKIHINIMQLRLGTKFKKSEKGVTWCVAYQGQVH